MVTQRPARAGNQCVLNPAVHANSFVATSDLHGGPLHPRHAGHAVEDGESDGNGDEEPADEGPQAAPPCPHLLSHHLDR